MLINESIVKDACEYSKKIWNEQPFEIRKIMSIGVLKEEINMLYRQKDKIKNQYFKDLKYINERVLMLSKEILKEQVKP